MVGRICPRCQSFDVRGMTVHADRMRENLELTLAGALPVTNLPLLC